jgi:hypothetical protein
MSGESSKQNLSARLLIVDDTEQKFLNFLLTQGDKNGYTGT